MAAGKTPVHLGLHDVVIAVRSWFTSVPSHERPAGMNPQALSRCIWCGKIVYRHGRTSHARMHLLRDRIHPHALDAKTLKECFR
jgi:hypothetical protein